MMSSQEPSVYQVGRIPMDQQEYENKFLKKFKEQFNVNDIRRASLHYTYEKVSTCPECGAHTEYDMDKAEIYCKDCGLVVKASIYYVGNHRIIYPYGILL